MLPNYFERSEVYHLTACADITKRAGRYNNGVIDSREDNNGSGTGPESMNIINRQTFSLPGLQTLRIRVT